MTQRTAFVDVTVYGVSGPNGILRTATVEDASDIVYLQVKDEDSNYVSFEDEAHYLYNWCRRHDFDYYEGNISTELDLELIND